MKETEKRIRDEVRKHFEKQDANRDEEGRIVLNIDLKNDAEIFSAFQTGNTIISEDFADFLENEMKAIPPKEKVCFKVHTQQSGVKVGIQNYFKNQYLEIQRQLFNNLIIFFALFGMAVLTLSFLFAFPYWDVHPIIQTIVEIVGWVFCWESVDTIFLKRHSLQYRKKRILSLLDSKIVVTSTI